MKFHSLILISLFSVLVGFSAYAADSADQNLSSADAELTKICEQNLNSYKSYLGVSKLPAVCKQVKKREKCQSVTGSPIYHYDKKGQNEKAKNILVISLIHGDETHAGAVGRYWMERIHDIDVRNNWRIIPVANPDGVKQKTRSNANGVDLNRNFPTQDWDKEATKYWKEKAQGSLRKFPGEKAGSEPEINCLLEHFKDYKPEFVISVHTPLNVLDFDGPHVKAPQYTYLPWKRLGNFPGSLGRFLWVEQNTPVLTVELKNILPAQKALFDQLQDVIGELVQKEIK